MPLHNTGNTKINEVRMSDKIFRITLVDSEERTQSFLAGWRDADNGAYLEVDEPNDDKIDQGVTQEVQIGTVTQHGSSMALDGNAWRDLEASGELENFLRDVVLGDRDGEEYLNLVAESLGVDEPGKVLY
jgi:hypothetical protein